MILIIAIIFLLTIIIIYKIWAYNNHWKYIMEIPGPKTYPIIGNYVDSLSTSEGIFNWDRQRAKQFWPIHKIWSWHIYFVSLMLPEDVELVLSNVVHNNKSILYTFLESWLGTGLLTSNGKKWHSRRKILTPAFHFNILLPFLDIFNRETEHLTEVLFNCCQQDYVDVVKPITEFTLYSIGETSLGVSFRDKEFSSYKQAINGFVELTMSRLLTPWWYSNFIYSKTQNYKKSKKYSRVLHNVSKNVIADRQEQRKFKDTINKSYSERKRLALLDLLLKAKDDGADIDDEGIREEVDTFMFEGHDTTAVALCYILLTLANEQQHQEEIYKEIMSFLDDTSYPTYQDLGEMKFMERCIKECLRLYPSVPFISRVAGKTFKTHSGYIIPNGSIVNIYIYDTHHSPHVWENPEHFDPDRFLPDNIAKKNPFAYLPFSAGGRNCIGQKFAMLELKAAVCGILRKFKLTAVDKRSDLKFKIDLVLRPVGEIKVKFTPR